MEGRQRKVDRWKGTRKVHRDRMRGRGEVGIEDRQKEMWQRFAKGWYRGKKMGGERVVEGR